MRLSALVPSTFLIALLFTGAVSAAPYTVDTSHSSVAFSLRHMFTPMQGHFKVFGGNFDFEPSTGALNAIQFTIDVKTINTNNTKRDEHLLASDFFDAARFPSITFISEKIKKNNKGTYDITGPMTLHGVTRQVTFNTTYHGSAKSPWGVAVSSFTAQTQINRKDFGLNWNKALDKGQVLIGDNVTITVDIEANPTPAAPATSAK